MPIACFGNLVMNDVELSRAFPNISRFSLPDIRYNFDLSKQFKHSSISLSDIYPYARFVIRKSKKGLIKHAGSVAGLSIGTQVRYAFADRTRFT